MKAHKEMKQIKKPVLKIMFFIFSLFVALSVYSLTQQINPVLDYTIGPSNYKSLGSECVSLSDGSKKIRETFDSVMDYSLTYFPVDTGLPIDSTPRRTSGFPLVSRVEKNIIFRCYSAEADTYQTRRADTTIVYAGSIILNVAFSVIVASLLTLLTHKIYKNSSL